MPRIPGRVAARATLAADPQVGEPEGFTVVEIVIGALLAGIFAAIVVFSVTSVTHRRPDPACTNEVHAVQDAIAEYKILNNNTNPASLDALVKNKPKLLESVPSPSSPSARAGYAYHLGTGDYSGGSCPSR